MPTQNVTITEAQAEFIRSSVQSGDYNSASELVREALCLLKERKEAHEARIAETRAKLQIGFDDYEAGRFIELGTKEERAAYFDGVNRRGMERLSMAADEAGD